MTTQIIKKPWGQEELIHVDEKYLVKRLTMNSGQRCSLQYHEKKTETVYVLSGVLRVLLGDRKEDLKELVLKANDSVTIKPFQVHRMEGIETSVYLEASTPELEDVVRLQDDYQRAVVT